MGSKQLLVLGCSKRKRATPGLLPAIERYDGPTYRVLNAFLRAHEWPRDLEIAVLSAKHRLVGGMTRIASYDQRMTPDAAKGMAHEVSQTLTRWAQDRDRVCVCLSQDYMHAVRPAIDGQLKGKSTSFGGGIGCKQSQVKGLLEETAAPTRRKPVQHEAGCGSLSYFLPDWDDLLDEHFDFETDTFSAPARAERQDKHCTILMRPQRMCDGILVSLAQHLAGKGPLRRFEGSHASSLAPVNLRRQFDLEADQYLFGDCGAFSYVHEDEPTIGVEQAVSLYTLYGFDFGASVDHIPVVQIAQGGKKTELDEAERRRRVALTTKNAEAFLAAVKKRGMPFTPVGTIQGLTPQGYAATARTFHELGYRYIAIGGLVPLTDAAISEIVQAVMLEAAQLKPRPWVHLFGVFRPKLQGLFRDLKVDSFDSATYFRKAWLRSDQNYLAANGKWYAAIRVPMTDDARTLKRLRESEADVVKLQELETVVLNLLRRYDRNEANLSTLLDAVLCYDEQLTRSSDLRSLREKYRETLRERPWTKCTCPFCRQLGIHIVVFRGCNRNKRRGAHNTLMLYNQVSGPRD